MIGEGTYYRLTEPCKGRFTAWQQVSPDRGETLVSLVLTQPEANPRPLHLKLKGLDPESVYTLQAADFFGCNAEMPALRLSGTALMYAGVTLPIMLGNTPSVQMIWKKAE